MINEIKWFFQRRIRGFDDRELWSLDASLAELILPRLIAFRKKVEDSRGVPADFVLENNHEKSVEAWLAEIDKMIFSFTAITLQKRNWTHETDIDYNEKLSKKVQEGLDSFAKYFRNLWT